MKSPSFVSAAVVFQAVACVWVLNAHLPGLSANPFPMPLWQQVATVCALAAGLLPPVLAVVRGGKALPTGVYTLIASGLGVALWAILVGVHPREIPPPVPMRLCVVLAMFYPWFAFPARMARTNADRSGSWLFVWWLLAGSFVFCELTAGEWIRLREWRIMVVESEVYAAMTDDARGFRVMPAARWRHVYSTDLDGYLDSERSVVYETNTRGLRERELATPKPAGVFRVVALGDSFTLGEGVHVGDTWPRALDCVLNERFPDGRIEVVNAGVSAYDLRQELEHYRRNVRAYDPDMVLVAMVWNDADPGDPGDFNAAFAGGSAALAQYLPLADRIVRSLATLVGRTGVRSEPGDWVESLEALAELRREAESDGAAFVAAIYPSVRHLENPSLRAVYGLQESFCRDNEIDVFNAWPAFREHNATVWHVHPADNHPNAAAHRHFANHLANHLEPAIRARLLTQPIGKVGKLGRMNNLRRLRKLLCQYGLQTLDASTFSLGAAR